MTKTVSSSYGYQKMVLFAVLYIGYALYVMDRKSFTFAMPGIIQDLNITKQELGLINSSLLVAYSISKFMGGLLSDYISPRVLFATGLFCSGLLTLIFPLFNNSMAWAGLWFIMGLVQGCGWPACAKLLREWCSKAEFGTWWSTISTSMNVAGGVWPFAATYLTINYNWATSMYIPGILSLCFTGVCLLLIKNRPQDVGLEPPDGEEEKPKNKADQPSDESTTYSWTSILTSPFIWLLCINYSIIMMVRNSIMDWGQLYLIEELNFSRYIASSFTSCLETGGLIGSLLAGLLADKLVKASAGKDIVYSPRMLVVLVEVAATTIGLYCLVFIIDANSSQVAIGAVGVLLGVCLYGLISLYGVMAVESVPTAISGRSHAVVALAANVGGVCAGLPLSYIAKLYSWGGAFSLLQLCVAAVTVLNLLTFRINCRVQPSSAHIKED